MLIVPTASAASALAARGFVVDPGGWRVMSEARFVERASAELDETTRQVIPYVVLRHHGRIFTYARNRAGNEARLHDVRSVGVGGHVNPGDLPEGLGRLASEPRDVLAAAARRELAEELVGLPVETPLEWLGFIFDDEAAVSRVHFGVVFGANVDPADVRLSEEGRMVDGRFVPIAELVGAPIDQYEGWSRLVIGHLAAGTR